MRLLIFGVSNTSIYRRWHKMPAPQRRAFLVFPTREQRYLPAVDCLLWAVQPAPNRLVFDSGKGITLFLFPKLNIEHNVTSTPNTRRFAVRQSSPTQSESHYPNSHGRASTGRNPVQKRTHQGIQALNQAGARYSFAKLISPNFLTSAYPCSLRVGVGMTMR